MSTYSIKIWFQNPHYSKWWWTVSLKFFKYPYISLILTDFDTWRGSFEPPHDKTNNMACVPREDSDQPGHMPSLIRVFAVHSVGSWGPKLSSWGQQRLWSDWVDVQADLSRRAHMPFRWFCHEVAQFLYEGFLPFLSYLFCIQGYPQSFQLFFIFIF